MAPPRGSLLALAGWIALAFVPAVIGGIPSSRGTYRMLEQPTWAPPGWLFGPVWTTLYLLMGIAAWLVWRERERVDVRGPLALFVVHLAVNALWTWLFFGWGLRGWALVEIVVLWLMIALLIVLFRRVRPLAGALLLPYLAWVTFATALTAAVWRLNVGA